jgi:hypothetical protein
MFTIIGSDGKEYGPVTADQIRQWMAENRLTRDMKARPVGATEWQRIGDLPEFAPPPPAAADPGSASPDGTAGTPAAPTLSSAPGAPERIEFTGEWSEYFRI